jgi:hypothetical protein
MHQKKEKKGRHIARGEVGKKNKKKGKTNDDSDQRFFHHPVNRKALLVE